MAEEKQNYTVQPKVEVTGTVQTSGYDMFTLVTKDNKVMIAVADKIVSRLTFDTEMQAQNYIDSKPWELLVNVACVCFDLINKQTK